MSLRFWSVPLFKNCHVSLWFSNVSFFQKLLLQCVPMWKTTYTCLLASQWRPWIKNWNLSLRFPSVFLFPTQLIHVSLIPKLLPGSEINRYILDLRFTPMSAIGICHLYLEACLWFRNWYMSLNSQVRPWFRNWFLSLSSSVCPGSEIDPCFFDCKVCPWVS